MTAADDPGTVGLSFLSVAAMHTSQLDLYCALRGFVIAAGSCVRRGRWQGRRHLGRLCTIPAGCERVFIGRKKSWQGSAGFLSSAVQGIQYNL